MVLTHSRKIIFTILFILSFLLIFADLSFAASGQFKLKSSSNDISAGQTAVVEVYVNTDTPVNAAELHLSYPVGVFDITIDSNGSAFGIDAPDKTSAGSIVIAKGNITPLNGEQLFVKLNVKANQNAKVDQLQAVTGSQILTSTGNNNIYTSTTIDAPGASNNTSTPATVTPTPRKEESVKDIIFRAIKEFFKKLFRL